MNTCSTSEIHKRLSESAECLKSSAELLIYPGLIHPREITKILGMEPTEEDVAGTTKTNSHGIVRKVKISIWFLISRNQINSFELSDHVDWLLNKIRPAVASLDKLRQMEGVIVWLNIVWWSGLGRGGPTLRPDQLRDFAELGMECPLDICYYGNYR